MFSRVWKCFTHSQQLEHFLECRSRRQSPKRDCGRWLHGRDVLNLRLNRHRCLRWRCLFGGKRYDSCLRCARSRNICLTSGEVKIAARVRDNQPVREAIEDATHEVVVLVQPRLVLLMGDSSSVCILVFNLLAHQQTDLRRLIWSDSIRWLLFDRYILSHRLSWWPL